LGEDRFVPVIFHDLSRHPRGIQENLRIKGAVASILLDLLWPHSCTSKRHLPADLPRHGYTTKMASATLYQIAQCPLLCPMLLPHLSSAHLECGSLLPLLRSMRCYP